MRKSKIITLILMLFFCSLTFGNVKQINIPKEEQVQKLVSAAWKKPIESIDVLYYEDYTGIPKPIEQIRKEVEEFVDREFKGRPIDKLEPYEIERRNKNIELNVTNRIKNQTFPRKRKEHVWISGDEQRTDSVEVGPNEPLGQDTPFVHTLINTKDANTADIVSYHYASEMKTILIQSTKWAKKSIGQFAGMPNAIGIQIFLGKGQDSTPKSLNFIPDPNKMAELARNGFISLESKEEAKAKGNKAVGRIDIRPDPNASGTRDIIEMGDPNYFPTAVLICDREDYSRVYRTEFYIPTTNKLIYLRECSDFDSQGFPHNVTEIQYDIDGNFKEKSVYKIIKVELNPSIPAKIFEFHLPEGYKVVDFRSKKP